MRIAFTLLAFLFTVGMARAQAPEEFGIDDFNSLPAGLKVGDKAPEINLYSQYGTEFSLADALEDGPVVLIFYRGNWCPYCSRFLAELTEASSQFDKLGARVVAVTAEKHNEADETAETLGTSFMLLSDTAGVVMTDYDVIYHVTEAYQKKLREKHNTDLSEHNEQEVARLPVAASYIINSDGEIVYRHFDLDYRNRASIDEILRVLKKL